MKINKEKIEKVVKRVLREYLMVNRDMCYDLNIPYSAIVHRDFVVNKIVDEIMEVLEDG